MKLWRVTLVVAIISQGFMSFSPVQAAGNLYTEYLTNTGKANRDSQSAMTISGRFKFNENGGVGVGGIGNHTVCTMTVTINLKYDKPASQAAKAVDNNAVDEWNYAGISYSNIQLGDAPGDYCGVNSGVLTIKNSNNDILKTLSNTQPPRDGKYKFIAIQKNGAYSLGVLNTTSGGSGDPAYIPASSFTDAKQITGAGESQVITGIEISNYGNGGGTAPTYTGNQIKSWTDAFTGEDKNLRIIFPDQSKPGNPPYIAPVGKDFVPADTNSSRPPLIFKFAAASFNTTFTTLKWLIFQAYKVDDKGKNPEIIPNFYLLMNDCSAKNVTGTSTSLSVDCFDLIYDTDQANVYIGIFDDGSYPAGAILINGNTTLTSSNAGGLAISDNDINKIFGYILNVPKDGSQSCQEGGVYLTGPPSSNPDGATVQDVQKKIPAVNQGVASNFEGSCASASGWLAYWGIKVNNQFTDGGCSVKGLFGNNDEIGGIFNALTKCLFEAVFRPLVDWAADIVSKAAGISYFPEQRSYLAERQTWLCVG